MIIERYPVDNFTVNVIRDDLILGGTKSRACVKYLSQYPNIEEFIYVGPSSGFSQLAITLAAKLLFKKVTLFVHNTSKITDKCKELGANIIYVDNLVNGQFLAQIYCKQTMMIIPFGLDSEEFNEVLFQELSQEINFIPTRVWLTVGSGTLLKVLARIWPNTEFMPVKVGKDYCKEQFGETWNRMGQESRKVLLTAPESFYQQAKILPPYPSVSNYDAKIWQFVLKYGQDGDYVWNIAADL